MPRLRSLRLLVGAALLVVAVGGDVRSAAAAGEEWELQRATPHPGVEVTRMQRAQPPLVVHVARISPDAPVELRPVLASGAVGDEAAGHGHETTSSMCSRAGGMVCVNADFNACPGCREPFGGVVIDGRVLRSFSVHHEQLSVGPRGLTTERVRWNGALRASYAWKQPGLATNGVPVPPARASTSTLDLTGLNVRVGSDEVVAYTSDWAPAAPAPTGGAHLSLSLSGSLVPGSVTVVGAERGSTSPIPASGVVIVASGAAVERLDRFWHEWATTDADERALIMETATSQPLRSSVGGHPVLLRGGQVLQLDQRDPKIRDRHPRTLAGWTAGGDLVLLTVDGRQPGYSEGVTLAEAQQLLLSMGVADGVNLDGGGSSTFVETCGAGRCVRNRPSDGSERRVTVALAVVPAPADARLVAADAEAPVAVVVPPAAVATPAPGQPAPTAAVAPVPLQGRASPKAEGVRPPPMAAPPSPAPAAAAPPGTATPAGVHARPLVPARADGAVMAPPRAVAAPAHPTGSPARPALPLAVVALGLWAVATGCTAAFGRRWLFHGGA